MLKNEQRVSELWKSFKFWKEWEIYLGGAPKSLQMVTSAMKLKDTCSLEEKLWQT